MALSRIAPRILCIGIPVRDLTFRVEAVPERGSKANATHLAEICGGNALNAAIAIVQAWRPRLDLRGRWAMRGRRRAAFILRADDSPRGIETSHIVRHAQRW